MYYVWFNKYHTNTCTLKISSCVITDVDLNLHRLTISQINATNVQISGNDLVSVVAIFAHVAQTSTVIAAKIYLVS